MKKKIEGFENEKELKIFENRLKNKNELIFHFWKISLDLALRVSDTLKITIKEANQYLKNGYYISKDKKTKKANQVALNENCIKSIKRALEIRKEITIKKLLLLIYKSFTLICRVYKKLSIVSKNYLNFIYIYLTLSLIIPS